MIINAKAINRNNILLVSSISDVIVLRAKPIIERVSFNLIALHDSKNYYFKLYLES